MSQTKSILTRPWVVGLAASFCCLLWGSAFPAVKIGYQLLGIGGEDSAAQIVYAGLRFFIAGILIVLFLLVCGRLDHFGRRLAQYGWTAAIIAITVFLVVWAIGSFRPQKL